MILFTNFDIQYMTNRLEVSSSLVMIIVVVMNSFVFFQRDWRCYYLGDCHWELEKFLVGENK